MTNAERKNLNAEIEKTYNTLMPPLYKRWSGIVSPGVVSEMFYYWIVKHHHEKNMNLFQKRRKRKILLKKKLEKLEALEVQEQLDNYVK